MTIKKDELKMFKNILMKKSKVYLPTLFTELMRDDPADDRRAVIVAVVCDLVYDCKTISPEELQKFWQCIQKYAAVTALDIPLVCDAKKAVGS